MANFKIIVTFWFFISANSVYSENLLPAVAPSRTSIITDPVQSGLNKLGIIEDTLQYNIHIPPPEPKGTPIMVQVSISLRNILDIDEVRQLITIETTLRLYWQDTRIKVNHLLPEGDEEKDYILVHPDTVKFIWCPDIYIDFAKALRHPRLIVPPASLRIYRNSTLRYASQVNYDVACPMSFYKYPRDTQICKVKLESYGYTSEKMDVRWKRGFDASKVTDNNSISLAQFIYAVSFEEEYREAIASGTYPGVIMTIALRRKLNYHLIQTFLPSALFVIVAWLSLFLPPESIPGRIAMAMTTLLTLAAMFGAVRQNTPRVSYVTALDIWMCACVVFVFLILLEYVIVLCLIHHIKVKTDQHDENSREMIMKKDSDSQQLQSEKMCFNNIFSNGRIRRVVHTTDNPAMDKTGIEDRATLQLTDDSQHMEAPKPRKVKTPLYMNVEIFSRYAIAIMFIVFNSVYWPLLLSDDDLKEYMDQHSLKENI